MRTLHALMVLGLSIPLLAIGPCSRLPGGSLTGEVASELPEDWSFVDQLGTCAIEARPDSPHSVTVTCYSSGGRLYVGSMNAAGKRWPRYVMEDPRVRYRAGGVTYELLATRVEDGDARNEIYRSRRSLGGQEVEPDLEAPDHYWIFRLDSRDVAAAPPPLASDAASAREWAEGIVAQADRSAEDREQDKRRHPVDMLVFAGFEPGMHVADLGAGGGYTAELLARAVGPQGVVYAQNTPAVIERFVSESWPARLSKDVMGNVERVDAELSDPLPPEARDLDLVTMIFVYHDTLATDLDRAQMNVSIFESLRPGGALIVMDHSAKPGAGEEVGGSLHRIAEGMLQSELEAAGFRLTGQADFRRNPDDTREQAFFRMEMASDAFVHRYIKPE